jgi:hypothetical protein
MCDKAFGPTPDNHSFYLKSPSFITYMDSDYCSKPKEQPEEYCLYFGDPKLTLLDPPKEKINVSKSTINENTFEEGMAVFILLCFTFRVLTLVMYNHFLF